MDLLNQNAMESSGWVFDVENSMNLQVGKHHKTCGGDTWYGWTFGSATGYISLVLEGSGLAILNYGNCNKQGVVNVFLNDDLVSSVNASVKNALINILFSNGDVLKVTEDSAIIKLNYFEIKCTGK